MSRPPAEALLPTAPPDATALPGFLTDPSGVSVSLQAAATKPGSIHVKLGDKSVGVPEEKLEAELSVALAAFGPIKKLELYNKGAYGSRPFAMVELVSSLPTDGPATALKKAGRFV